MLKADLVKIVAKEVGLTQVDAEKAINWTFRLVADCIKEEGRFAFDGFGVFKKVRRAASDRPNPQDRTKRVHTPAHYTVKFRPSPKLKELMKG
jgi:nucleoid DNA-binding protein